MGTLRAKQRNKMADSTFALPSKRKYPIPDISHARAALSRAAQSNTEGSYDTVRAAVLKKFPGLKDSGGKLRKKR